MISNIVDYMKTDIWRIRLKDIPPRKSFFIKCLRIFLLTVRGFSEDRCQLRASALTFYSLLSIVPVVAMAFGIAKGFGFEKLLEKQLLEQFPGQEEVMMQTVFFARSLLEKTKGGMIAGIGVVVLIWTVIKVMGSIEGSFNAIWKIKESRSIGRKLNNYLAIMLISPILWIMSSSVTVFITTEVTLLTKKVTLLEDISPVILFALNILPYSLIWILFTVIYMIMPNIKVHFKSGFLAGIVAGTIYQAGQLAYITFQVGVSKYNTIYGSFAALPLFLVWLQLSWLILLFGAELSFANQNVDSYEFEPDSRMISYSFNQLLSLTIAHLLIGNFSKGEKPLTAAQISYALEIPLPLVRRILCKLVEAGIVSHTETQEDRKLAYQPARDISLFTIRYVIEALENIGVDNVPVAQTNALKRLSEILQNLRETIEQSPENKLLRDI